MNLLRRSTVDIHEGQRKGQHLSSSVNVLWTGRERRWLGCDVRGVKMWGIQGDKEHILTYGGPQ